MASQIFLAVTALLIMVLIARAAAGYINRNRTQAAEPAPELGRDFRAAWSDADEFVSEAERYVPFLVGSKRLGVRGTPYFWPAVITSTVLVLFALAGGWSLGQGSVYFGLLMCLIFGMINVIQAIIAVSGDKGTAPAWELQRSDRSVVSWGLLSVILILNMLGAFIGSSVIGSDLATKSEITASTNQADLRRQKLLAQELADLKQRRAEAGNRSPSALKTEAKRIRDEAIRESWRRRSGQTVDEAKVQNGEWGPKCGADCSTLLEQAKRLEAMADDAAREAPLQQQLALLNERLKGASGSIEANPWAARIAETGLLTADTVARNMTTVLQWVVAIIDFFLWIRVGDAVGAARAREYRRRAELANARLIAEGEQPRYMLEPPEAPTQAAASRAETVVIGVEADPATIIAASSDLSAIDAFFAAALQADESRKIGFGVAYAIFVERQKVSGAKTWMAKATPSCSPSGARQPSIGGGKCSWSAPQQSKACHASSGNSKPAINGSTMCRAPIAATFNLCASRSCAGRRGNPIRPAMCARPARS